MYTPTATLIRVLADGESGLLMMSAQGCHNPINARSYVFNNTTKMQLPDLMSNAQRVYRLYNSHASIHSIHSIHRITEVYTSSIVL